MLKNKKTTMSILAAAVFTALFCLIFSGAGFAQQRGGQAAGAPERIVRPMVALDPITLRAEGISIRLWGIKMAQTRETPLELRAMEFIDRTIGGEPVSCRIEKWDLEMPTARCSVHTNEDLALALLQQGFAIVDRNQTYGSAFASHYEEAQHNARQRRAGVWEFVLEDSRYKLIPDWLDPYMSSLVPMSLIFGPLLGLALISLAVRQGFRNMVKRQETEFQETREKEEALLRRETLVLAAALEGELSENKNKLQAFLTIYQNLLSELQRSGEDVDYQKQTSGLIHKHTALNRTVFDGNISKLSTLDMQLASTLSKLYTHIHAEPEYITIDSKMPYYDVVEMVKKAIDNSEMLLPQIDYALEQLEMTMQKHLEIPGVRGKQQAKAPPPPSGPVAQKPPAVEAQGQAAAPDNA